MGFPLISGVLAGDIFSSEDRYGTWKTVLTRSRARHELFWGKVAAAAVFSLALLALSAVASLIAGIVFVGAHPLVGLSGAIVPSGKALALVLAAWALNALPMLGFVAIAVLFSVVTRNGIIGVIGPSIIALVMNLLALVGTGTWVHVLLLASAFGDWHALFTSHPYYGQLVIGCLVSVAWILTCLWGAWAILRRRDFAGVPVTRRAGWIVPVRVALMAAVVIALVAIATNLGPTGVTASRLRASLTPAFNRLTILQQQELGRAGAGGRAPERRWPTCSRRAWSPQGPGDWVCTLNVYIPQAGIVPFQQTPVSYDLSVQSDGCYKAQSPPSFIGQQLMRDASGNQIVNPLYTIYGCFNTL